MFGVGGSIIFALISVFLFDWGVFGLAFASSVGGFLNVAYLYFKSHFEIDIKDITVSLLKNSLATAGLVGTIELIKWSFAEKVLVVFLGIFVSSAVYFVINFLLRDENTIMFYSIIKKKIRGQR